jgi:hypothetical protein
MEIAGSSMEKSITRHVKRFLEVNADFGTHMKQ